MEFIGAFVIPTFAATTNALTINCTHVISSTFEKIFNTRLQETVDVCLEMFNCLQAEQTIAIRKRKFLNKKFSAINNVLRHVFVVDAKKELESCCAGVK